MIEERYELALDRIRLMQTEDTVGEPYRDYFKKMAEFVLMLDELRTELLDGRYQKLELDELRKNQEEKKMRTGYYGRFARCRNINIRQVMRIRIMRVRC